MASESARLKNPGRWLHPEILRQQVQLLAAMLEPMVAPFAPILELLHAENAQSRHLMTQSHSHAAQLAKLQSTQQGVFLYACS